MLDPVNSNRDITSTLLTYLSFDTFENLFSETWDQDDVRKNIKSQDLLLFDYAATEWISHLRGSCTVSSKTFPQDFIDILSKFAHHRRNLMHQPRDDVIINPRYYGLGEYPALQSLVTQAESHHRRRQTSILEVEQGLSS